jgi:cob(I)alamin adenosyltransferase
MKIYTKTGDKGDTSLFGGKRVKKYHSRIEAYGTLDELNSWTGFVRDQIEDEEIRAVLLYIQDRLFTMGSHLATEKKGMKLPLIFADDVEMLEANMDLMEAALPPMRHFVLPGGHPVVSQIHIARCVCRRAERLAVALSEEAEIESLIIMYLNRLSDYYFMLSRYMALKLGAKENPWIPEK